MMKLEKKAGPDIVGSGHHINYLNLYSRLSGVSLKGVKQKLEMEYM